MSEYHAQVHVRRLKVILLISSLVSLLFLILAAFEENFAGEWRKHRAAYRAMLLQTAESRAAVEAFQIGFQQIFLPELGRVDRCVTCHVGIDNPKMAQADQPFRAHPGTILDLHPQDKFGCTVCHDGQGRAVSREAAHGEVQHWSQPLLRGEKVYRSCGRCHYEYDLYGSESDQYFWTGPPSPLDEGQLLASIPGAQSVARGKKLLLESGCLGCHKYRGRGGLVGPDISFVGDKTAHDFDFTHIQGEHTVEQWLVEHFKRPQAVSPGTVMPEFDFSDEEIHYLTEYLLSLRKKNLPAAYTPVTRRTHETPVGGRRLYAMFCSACHGEHGAGSTVRDPLLEPVADAPPELMVPSLNHPDTLAVASDDYLRYIIAAGRPETNMIAWSDPQEGGLLPQEIDRLVEFIRSWQPPRPDESGIAASRGDPALGKLLYDQNCASCHGTQGQGGIGTRLNSPSFLSVASDEFLAVTLIEGRPNTAMPSWRQLDSQQISDLIAYMRSWNPARNDIKTVLSLVTEAQEDPPAANVSPDIGKTLYEANCVTCHGESGQGDLGPSLSTQEFLTLVSDKYLYDTISTGRPGTAMPAWRHLSSKDIASVILYIRQWQTQPQRILPDRRAAGDWDVGQLLFKGQCAGCHGENAEGGAAPQLNNPMFLDNASDAMLWEWIAYGKRGTPMRAFLKNEQGIGELRETQIDNIVAYLRSLQRRPHLSVARSPNGRPELGAIWYARSCVPCHGVAGEGSSGPSLSNPSFLAAASDGFLLATMAMGRDGTEMRPVKKGAQSILSLTSDQINDLVAYLRSWEIEPPAKGIPHRFVIPWDLEHGRQLYESNCSGCHGINGKADLMSPGLSAWAPELNNEGFLAAATDGFLQATIVRGRSGTAMRPFGHSAQGLVDLSMKDIDDLVAYIRHWSTRTPWPTTIPAEAGRITAERRQESAIKNLGIPSLITFENRYLLHEKRAIEKE